MAHGLEALAESGYGLSATERLLWELEELGFTSEDFRTTAAYALERLANAEVEASDDTLSRLEGWLRDATELEPVPERKSSQKLILWGWGGGGVLPRGNYPALSVLTVLLLTRPQPRFDDWVELLLRHLGRREESPAYGQCYCPAAPKRALRQPRPRGTVPRETFRALPWGTRLTRGSPPDCGEQRLRISSRITEDWLDAICASDSSMARHTFPAKQPS